MKLQKIREELINLLEIVENWEESNEAPQIEIDIAKRKMQKLYLLFANDDQTFVSSHKTAKDFQTNKEDEKTPLSEEEKEILQAKAINHTPSEEEFEGEMQSPFTAKFPTEEQTRNEEEQEEKLDEEEISEDEEILEDEKEELIDEEEETQNDEDEVEDEDETDVEINEANYEEEEEEQGVNPEEVKRLHYIYNLFEGDEQKYEDTVAELDAMDSFEDVLFYISENFKWSSSNETAQSFVDKYSTKF